jgi:hypothetical protein
MENRWCSACGGRFSPDARCSKQSYCAKSECQRERKRLWQKLKRQSDPDYLENQARAQRAWCERNTDYWRAYRASHPEYTLNNRQRQRDRRNSDVAKMDSIAEVRKFNSGLYRICAVDSKGVAKMDSVLVRLSVVERDSIN